MATGTPVHSGSALTGHGGLLGRDVAHWLTARVHDAGHEAVFTVETDARFWRLRRAHGATASTIEARLPMTATPGDLAQAVARWAPSAGLAARVHADGAAVRVVLSRRQD